MTTITATFHISAAAAVACLGLYKLRTLLLWFGILAPRETFGPDNNNDDDDDLKHINRSAAAVSDLEGGEVLGKQLLAAFTVWPVHIHLAQGHSSSSNIVNRRVTKTTDALRCHCQGSDSKINNRRVSTVRVYCPDAAEVGIRRCVSLTTTSLRYSCRTQWTGRRARARLWALNRHVSSSCLSMHDPIT